MLRYYLWLRVFMPTVACLFTWAAVVEWRERRYFVLFWWLIMAVAGWAATLEVFVGRIELRPDGLTIVGPFERRAYSRAQVAGVKSEWKVGLSLRLQEGKWVPLQNLGFMPGGVEAVRRWAKGLRANERTTPLME